MTVLYLLVFWVVICPLALGWLGLIVIGFKLLFDAYRNHRPKTAACVTLIAGFVWLVLVWEGFSLARYRGKLAVCQANLLQIGLAVQMYRDDHNGQMPPTLSVIQSNTSPRVFECTEGASALSREDASFDRPQRDSDYEYRFVARPSSNDVIFWDLNEHRPRGGWRFFIPARRPVLYADGHVEALDQQKFQMLNLSTNLVGITR